MVTPFHDHAKFDFALLLKGITRSLEDSPQLLTHFNNMLKMDPECLTEIKQHKDSGQNFIYVNLHLLKPALKSTSRYANELALSQHIDIRISTILWNPIVEGALDAIVMNYSSMPILLPRIEPGHTYGSPAMDVMTTHPQNPKMVPTRPEILPIMDPKDVPELYRELSIYLATRDVVFKQRHVTCRVPYCAPCKSLARQLALTPCVGHLPCLTYGWFPHVTKSLWLLHQQKLKAGIPFIVHKRGIPGSLPSLCQYLKKLPTRGFSSVGIPVSGLQNAEAPSNHGSGAISDISLPTGEIHQNHTPLEPTASNSL